MSRIALAVMALFLLSVAALAERPRPLGWGLDAMRSGSWDTAAALAARDGPVAADIVEWHRLRAGRGTWQDINAFLARRPDWPGEAFLRRKSEPAIARANAQGLLDFYADTPPQTAQGALDYAQAQIAHGNEGEAQATIVLAWRSMDMSASTRARYLSRHGDLIAPHHSAHRRGAGGAARRSGPRP